MRFSPRPVNNAVAKVSLTTCAVTSKLPFVVDSDPEANAPDDMSVRLSPSSGPVQIVRRPESSSRAPIRPATAIR